MNRLFLLLTLLLASCAGIPSDAPAFSLEELPATGSNVYIYRMGLNPTERKASVFVNDKLMTKNLNYSYSKVVLPAGKHNLKIRMPRDAGSPKLSYNFSIEDGKEYFIKMTGKYLSRSIQNYPEGKKIPDPYANMLTNSNGIDIYMISGFMDKEIAINELQTCCKYTAPEVEVF